MVQQHPDQAFRSLLAAKLRAQLQEPLNIRNGLCHGLLSSQCSATQSYLHHEYAAIGLFHKISNEVAKNLNRRILTLKMQVCRKPEAQQG